MWSKVSKIILRNRLAILLVLGLITVSMAYYSTKVGLQYEFAKLLPENDETYTVYQDFKKEFGQDGLAIVIACNDADFYTAEKFAHWFEFGNRLHNINVLDQSNNKGDSVRAVDSVFSEAHLYVLNKNKELKTFELKPIVSSLPIDAKMADSIKQVVSSQKFYQDLVFKKDANMHLMVVFVNQPVFNSKSREGLVERVRSISESYAPFFGELHYSGLPFIRSVTMNKVKKELILFVILAITVTSLLLFFFFRSFKVVIVSLIVVAIGVIWSMGTIGIAGYEITIVMGLIPPLLIVIGIPNCVYLINKYQQEYRIHGSKARSLTRVIRKVGNATFMTNATTAMGFGTFIFTKSDMMKEFGVIAAINILCMFFLSILIVPIIYSYLAPPKSKHTKHLDKKWLDKAVDYLVDWACNYRKTVYISALTLVGFGIFGMSLMRTSGNIVDDLPKNDLVVKDLKYFEKELGGVLPFEIIIEANDTIYKKNAYNNFVKIDSIQSALRPLPYLSRSMSLIDAIKYVKQAYANGNESAYQLGSQASLAKILDSDYFKNTFNLSHKKDSSALLKGFLDASQTKTRISVQIADVGTDSMRTILEEVGSLVDDVLYSEKRLFEAAKNASGEEEKKFKLKSLFEEHSWVLAGIQAELILENADLEFEFMDDENLIYSFINQDGFFAKLENIIQDNLLTYKITGSGVVYTKGTTYLVQNLFTSLILAILVIALLMSFLFRSWRMVLVSLIPNLIPLIITSAIMGITGIPIKPSTILVFSIAFGISVDDTIHFLAKYRQELNNNSWDIKGSVVNAIRETGVSMIYTSIILFFGFSIFMASNFGGTQALGVLVSVTLFVAMLANLVLLPALLLTLEKLLTTKAFKDPLLEVLDEEEDVELEKLEIEGID